MSEEYENPAETNVPEEPAVKPNFTDLLARKKQLQRQIDAASSQFARAAATLDELKKAHNECVDMIIAATESERYL